MPRNKGFTFIELAFAGGILFVGLCCLLGAMVSISNTARIEEVRQELSVYALSYLEALRSEPLQQGLSRPPQELSPCPDRVALDVACLLPEGKEAAVPLAPGVAVPPLVEVKVVAGYTGERHRIAVPLASLFYSPVEDNTAPLNTGALAGEVTP